MPLVKRCIQMPQQSFFLFGPRGTGKSTWLKVQYPDALYIDLLQTDVFRELVAYPEKLAQIVNAHKDKDVVVIDEIQKAPDLLSMVHKLMEEQPGKRFILTGSSARKLKRQGVDLLAGRALKKTIHPFMASELGDSFDLGKALVQGLVPIVTTSPTPGDVLKTYIDIYLNEEVKLEGMVRNIGDFTRFLHAAALTHGQILNITNVAYDCQVNRKTVEGYFSIVEDLLIGYTVPVFTKRAQRALVAHPKFYYFDCGVYRSLRPVGPLDTAQETGGAALEGLVLQHLRAWLEYGNRNAQIYFWKSRDGAEVDFVIYGEAIFAAIEVKSSQKIKSQHLRGLKSFRKDYPQCAALMLYCGKERLLVDDILCAPCDKFLLALVPGNDLPFISMIIEQDKPA